MVVLASSICTRGGKALLSRSFRDLSKDRITALLANFPSLISNSSSNNTAVEDEHVRYVYQPLEEFYIILITTKNSNILQDIDTLHLFASTVSNLLRSVDEREIFENAFEILSAFDEIVTLGYKENLTMSQVQSFLEMDSHEEKIQEIIERNKELEANEERKRRAKEIQRKELARKTMERFPHQSVANFESAYQQQPTYNSNTIMDNSPGISQSEPSGPSRSLPHRGGGLQLGKKSAGPQRGGPLFGGAESNQPLLSNSQPLFQHSQAQTNSSAASNGVNHSTSASPAPSSAPKHPNNGILITINEKISANLSREGTVSKTEVKGDLKLRINNSDYAQSKIILKAGKSGVQYKTRPEIDNKLFNSSNILALKDSSKSFPSNDQSSAVLRWRAVGGEDDTSYLPIIFTVWVNLNDNVADITLEYELSETYVSNHPSQTSFDNVKILVPVVSHDVTLKDEPEHVSFDITEYGIVFNISEIPLSEPQGSFEFSISTSEDEEAFFPMQVQFESERTNLDDTDISFGKIQILDVVTNNDDEESLPFDLHSVISSEEYYVV